MQVSRTSGDQRFNFTGVIQVLINHLFCNKFILVLIVCFWALIHAASHSEAIRYTILAYLIAMLPAYQWQTLYHDTSRTRKTKKPASVLLNNDIFNMIVVVQSLHFYVLIM